MSLIFVTGDQHFGHAAIIEHCQRPFAGAREMDREIVRRWRKAVSPADTVYVLGDFACGCSLEYAQAILDRLYGKKVLVAGSWDRRLGRLLSGWADAADTVTIREPGRPPVVLRHHPPRSWPDMRRGAIMLHAHVHSKRMAFGDSLRADCGVDATDFWPIPLASVYKMAEVREKGGGQ